MSAPSAFSWECDTRIAQRHAATLGLRAAILFCCGAAAIPATIRVAVHQLGNYKSVLVQAAQAPVASQPLLRPLSEGVLECVDVPPAEFGDAVVQRTFGGKSVLQRRLLAELADLLATGLVEHAAGLAAMALLDRVAARASSPGPLGAVAGVLSLRGSPFPSFVALHDFAASSHALWSARIAFLVPSAVLRLVFSSSCAANPAITPEVVIDTAGRCAPADLAKWQLALVAPHVAVTATRLARYLVLAQRPRSARAPLPSSGFPAGSGKTFARFRAGGWHTAMATDIALAGISVGLVWALASRGPQLCSLAAFVDERKGAPYAWSCVGEVLASHI